MKSLFLKNKFPMFFLLIFFLGLFFITVSVNIADQAKAACVADGACNYGGGENMFNCKADCLPAGVPTKSIKNVINDATSWILGFATFISVAVLAWGGVYYVGSSGSTEKAETARKIIKYALMGLIVAGVSYAMVVIISRVFGP